MMSNSEATAPWWRHRWPWLLMLGPAVVVVAGVITVWIAIDGADEVIRDGHVVSGKVVHRPEASQGAERTDDR